VKWGIANPERRKVLRQLQVSDVLTKDCRESGGAPFAEVQAMIRVAIAERVLRDDVPVELISWSLVALAEATMDLMALHPIMAKEYRDSGFEMFWAGITKHSAPTSNK
jgi:hypothetical protein